MSTRLDELNRSPDGARQFLRCCGSARWARMMAAARPFVTRNEMADRADAIWWSLDRADWLEAFAAHPRIGQNGPGQAGGAGRAGGAAGAGPVADAGWSEQEQSGAQNVSDAVRDRLARANRDYHARFGYIFIVCATGKTADEMLAMLERRMANAPEAELAIAAEEQRKITQLRLAKLLT